MSDDDYYYDSPYEDLQDILYDADPAPDLADDLAEHAAYSPVWQDDPLSELQTYFSDWEYYSDDYYDDDPNILKNDPQDGSGRRGTKLEPRGRKRKLAETKETVAREKEEQESLARCIRGTVWADGTSFMVNTYEQGQQDKVALKLSKEVMHSAYSKNQGFGRGRLRRDESWANELSLADMGLHNEMGKNLQQDVPFDEDAEGDDEYESHIPEDDIDALSENGPDARDSAIRMGVHALSVDPQGASDHDMELDELPSRRKRSKLGVTQANEASTSTRSKLDGGQKNSHKHDASAKRNANRRLNDIEKGEEQEEPQQSADVAKVDKSPKKETRKRKLSLEDSLAPTTGKTREAKRVASSRLTSSQSLESKPKADNSRTSRNRKK